MCSSISSRRVFICLISVIICSTVFIHLNLPRIPFNILQKDSHSHCFEWQCIDHGCPHYSQMHSLIWTYNSTGIMKYLQWIVTRKLGNIRITQLNHHCHITQENYFSSDSIDHMFVQVYILSLSSDFTHESTCSLKINQIANMNVRHINHIYFKRKSTKATVIFQQLDSMTHYQNFTFNPNVSLEESFKKANYVTKRFPSYFTDIRSIKWITIDSEDFIKTKLIDCEKILTDFISLLGLTNSSLNLNDIIPYDSHHFIEDSTWWDQSEVAERILTMSIPPRPSNLTYSNDFYYLHGDRSFIQYLSKNRQCYNEGIFAQMQSETITNRSSTDHPERCSSKPFDCAFSDLYSFHDREQMYQQFNPSHYFKEKSLKCAFAIPSIFDKVRNRYGRNDTCQTIVFTSVTNCYDPLPQIQGVILPSFCFVAVVDTKTFNAYKKLFSKKSNVEWDLIDLGTNEIPFSVAAKSTETLKIVGERMFPLAKWIIWLDGKGGINDISELLIQAQAPMIGAPHPDPRRTSASEAGATIYRLGYREKPLSLRLNNSILDINLQEKEYKHDGFYSRSDALKLKLYDIAVFLYKNHHPCISRYLCGWHSEVNYYSYRGQLSVYYSAVRLNLTNYLHFLPKKFYTTVRHRSVC